jgi:DNA-binding XRE family transcriptional regulator
MRQPAKPCAFLKEIRTAIGWSQRQLAERLGVSTITVRRIESGSLKMSRAFAIRFFWETGYNGIPGNVILAPQPKTLPYTYQDYLDWKATFAKSTAAEREALADGLHQWIQVLFEAAADTKVSADLFPPVFQAVSTALNDIALEFRLVEKSDAISRKRWPGLVWNPTLVPPTVKDFGPMSMSEILGMLSGVRSSPSQPSIDCAGRVDGHKPSLPTRHRRGVRATSKP